jgi:hypothetical protein
LEQARTALARIRHETGGHLHRTGDGAGAGAGAALGPSAELERLSELHRRGDLDDAEFAAAKQQVLVAAR